MKTNLIFVFLVLCISQIFAQTKTKYPDIPRIDVHTHVANDYAGIEKYLELRNLMLSEYSSDLAMWINLGGGDSPIRNTDSVSLISKNRILCTISDYDPFHGLKNKPEDLNELDKNGFIGYKIWYGPWYRKLEENEKGFRYVDDPANEAMFAKMEELGILATSIHIADPNGPINNRTKWCADPVEYWREITAFHNVLKKHPDLNVVAAHASWLICQDAQIDYLRFLLATYPNLNIDLAATFQYFYLITHDNLRDFMIEYADRILFGTDASSWDSEEETIKKAEAYNRCFRILETDEIVEGGFFNNNNPVQGLNLPREVLEKIYYKNAARIYPKIGERMSGLGY